MGCYIYVNYFIFLLSGLDKFESYIKIKNIDYKKYFSDATIIEYSRIIKNNICNYKLDEIRSTGYVVSTLESVLWVVLNTDKFVESVIGAINLGGDTDTIGAITGSIAGIIYGYNNIPKNWLSDLKGKKILNEYIKNYSIYFKNEFH